MARWKQGVRRTTLVIVAAFALCAGLGYIAALYAQSSTTAREDLAIRQAVNSNRIDTLSSDQSKILSRLDAIDVRQAVMSDRISQMFGIGIGGMGVLSVLSALGIGLHLKRSKPSS
jgi:hypothetical protein